MTSNNCILESFLQLFQCGGAGFTDDYEQDAAVVQQQKHIFLEQARPIGSCSVSSPTSIYSIPSRESMTEIRQDSVNRFGRSRLFSYTSSTPMRFSFEDYHSGEYELEKRDDSIRTNSARTESRQYSPPMKRSNSIATVTTADSNSVGEDLQAHSSEDSPEFQVDVVAVRE
ncbi:unnamed protein product [Cylindrotheca closterium]|uniref:Uncharacterized protein n=1 Tax=Cylindrotheca closterium TaxID=2856 RepID=A0AAD2FHQ3_9STRA|nr:unnamed protein product [Cylindrotheca closterium]